jgi:hypothetical protein
MRTSLRLPDVKRSTGLSRSAERWRRSDTAFQAGMTTPQTSAVTMTSSPSMSVTFTPTEVFAAGAGSSYLPCT